MLFYYVKNKESLNNIEIDSNNIYFIEDSEELITHGKTYKFMKIADDLASEDDSKALSANQGVVLYELINNTILIVEGTSGSSGEVNTSIIPSPPSGYSTEIINVMYLNPTLNTWCPCIPYNSGDSTLLVCGEITVSSQVIFTTLSVTTHSNCSYKIYYRFVKD